MNPDHGVLCVSAHYFRGVLCLAFLCCIPSGLRNDRPAALKTGAVCRTVDPASCREAGSSCQGNAHRQHLESELLQLLLCETRQVIPLCSIQAAYQSQLSCSCSAGTASKYAVELFQNWNKASGLLRLGQLDLTACWVRICNSWVIYILWTCPGLTGV